MLTDSHCSRSQATRTAVCLTEIHGNFESVHIRSSPHSRFPVWQKRRQTCLNVCFCLQGKGGLAGPVLIMQAFRLPFWRRTRTEDGIQFPPTLNPRRRQTDDDITALTQNNGPPSLPDFLRTNHAMHPSRREREGGKTRTTRGHS